MSHRSLKAASPSNFFFSSFYEFNHLKFISHFIKMPQLVWLVTGCSSGLGEELVYVILASGDQVIATGRNAAEKLSHLKDTGAVILNIDVTAPQEELDAKMKEALAIYGVIGVLVPNAGYSEIEFVEELRQVIEFQSLMFIIELSSYCSLRLRCWQLIS
jgi:NAD(P)-dependent dehydrogenase (short-subunit alcohol dehydrogenase family)